MQTETQVLKYPQIQYTWFIKDLNNYFNSVDEHESLTIKSPDLKSSCYIYRCYLKIKILSRSITCSLHFNTSTSKRLMKVKCNLSLVNSADKVLKAVNFQKSYTTDVKEISDDSPTLLLTSDELLSESDLFPADTLKVICELTSIYLPTEMEPKNEIYIPISCSSMKSHFKELLESKVGADMVFQVDDKEFKAHKSILLARSPVFAAMFGHDMVENNTNRVKIEDISKSTFELLLDFIYTDEIQTELDVEIGLSLLQAACKYQLDGLKNLCEAQLFKLMSTDNAAEIQKIAEAHNLVDFKRSVDAFINQTFVKF